MSEADYYAQVAEIIDASHLDHAPSTRAWFASDAYTEGLEASSKALEGGGDYDAYEARVKAFDATPIGKAYKKGLASSFTPAEGVWRALVGTVDPKEFAALTPNSDNSIVGDDKKVMQSITMKQIAAGPIDDLESDVDALRSDLSELVPPESASHSHDVLLASLDVLVSEAKERQAVASSFNPSKAREAWVQWHGVGNEDSAIEHDADYDGIVDDAKFTYAFSPSWSAGIHGHPLPDRLAFVMMSLVSDSTSERIALVAGKPEAGLVLGRSTFMFECAGEGGMNSAVSSDSSYVAAAGKQCSSFAKAGLTAALTRADRAVAWINGVDVAGTDPVVVAARNELQKYAKSERDDYAAILAAIDDEAKLAVLAQEMQSVDNLQLYQALSEAVRAVSTKDEG